MSYAGVLVGMRYFHSPAAAGAMLVSDYQTARRNMRGGFSETDARGDDMHWDDADTNHSDDHGSSSARWSSQAAQRHP